jgi:hypothetical protein
VPWKKIIPELLFTFITDNGGAMAKADLKQFWFLKLAAASVATHVATSSALQGADNISQ